MRLQTYNPSTTLAMPRAGGSTLPKVRNILSETSTQSKFQPEFSGIRKLVKYIVLGGLVYIGGCTELGYGCQRQVKSWAKEQAIETAKESIFGVDEKDDKKTPSPKNDEGINGYDYLEIKPYTQDTSHGTFLGIPTVKTTTTGNKPKE